MAMKMKDKAEQLPQTGNEVQPSSTPPTSTRRSDPFGQRFLRDEATVFDHNAWDNVEWPEEKEEEIGRILNSQGGCPVPPEDAFELLDTPATQWEAFYQTHNNKFFMDRKWIAREFPELFQV
jgi:tRNAThr (cytosine32-N3)-methyltransferase